VEQTNQAPILVPEKMKQESKEKKTSVPKNSAAWKYFEKLFIVDEENP
jgi:hypothetical protein